MTDIALARLTSIVYDPRVHKIANSLKKRYSVLVLGWNREKIPGDLASKYVTDLKLFNLAAPRGESMIRSPKMLLGYVSFWTWLFFELVKCNPKIVHSCDLDTVIPCYLYKLLFRRKLIFDVFDRYAMAYIPTKNRLYHSTLNFLEEFFSKRSDVLVNVSEDVMSTFKKKPECSIVIMNCPEDHLVNKRNSDKDKVLTIVYTGAILRKTRGLENIIVAIENVPNVEFVMAGWYLDSDKEFLNEMLKKPNVKYRGLLQPNDALALEASSDVIIALYEPTLLWNYITLPNKVFEAMMCGVPLITNVATRIINEVGFGIVVQYDDIKEIKEAILRLRNEYKLRQELGSSGRKAYLEKYSWAKMEQILFGVYDILVPKIRG